MCKKLIRTIVILFSVILCSTSMLTEVQALTDADNNALKSHPGGLNIENYFTIDTPEVVKDTQFRKNSATIKGNNKDVLVLTDGAGSDATGSYGAIWGNSSSQNYLNINERQTISAWLYFGPDNNDELYNGHGMTLTLQNDPRKTKAIGTGIQGLGAYGYDKYYMYQALYIPTRVEPSNDIILNTAIKNSMSLEFDTQRSDVSATVKNPANDTNGRSGRPVVIDESIILGNGNGTYSMNGYDTKDIRPVSVPNIFPETTRLGAGGSYGHIALTYPGIIDSYAKYPIESDDTKLWRGFDKTLSMFNIDPTEAYLISDEDLEGNPLLWHHVTFEWIPHDYDDKATIKYSYNDKDTDGKENFNTTGKFFKRINKETIVDPSVFNASDDGRILWGFTGANGHTDGVHSKIVVFESIPGMAKGDIEVTIKNLDNGKIVTEEDNYVPYNANLEIRYRAKFVEGRENWQSIKGMMDLPKNVFYDGQNGLVAMLTYEDGTQIPNYDALHPGGFMTNVAVPILKPLGNLNGNLNNYADVVVKGRATNDTSKDHIVSPETAVFTGSNAIASASTPEFIIGSKKTWELKLDGGGDIELPFKQDGVGLSLATQLSYTEDHSIAETDKFDYTIAIDGIDKKFKITDQVDPETGKLNLDLMEIVGDEFWDIFKQDFTKTVTIYATDKDAIKSNEITYNVHVIPNRMLSLEVTPTLDFQPITTFTKDPILNRTNDYDVVVKSLRNPWTLSVAGTNLVSQAGNVFDGNMVYLTDSNKHVINDDLVNILSDTNSYLQSTPINIADSWTRDTGILLQQFGNNQSGQYQGTLSWQVGDYLGDL